MKDRATATNAKTAAIHLPISWTVWPCQIGSSVTISSQSVVQHREALTTSDVRASFSRVELHCLSIAFRTARARELVQKCWVAAKNKHGSRDFRACANWLRLKVFD